MNRNRLHPVFHLFTYQSGSRIDIDVESILNPSIEDDDLDLLIDSLSESPIFIERIAPLGVQVGQELIKGKNYTEVMLKGYRVLNQICHNIETYVKQSVIDNFKEKGMVPFSCVSIAPNTLTQILEMDYETGDNVYSQIMSHYANGVISPGATVPFHNLMPLVKNDFDLETLVRIGFMFYWHTLKEHYNYMRAVHGESRFIVSYWLPEGAYSERVGKILFKVFTELTSADKDINESHLVLVLDNQQIKERENDKVMKSWNIVQVGDKKNEVLSVLFKDRNFSDWVTYSNPSVKKLLDRTIAKVDSELNDLNVDYCWSHYEDVENILRTHKSAKNFEQKIIKLIELGYLPTSPEIFVRRKINKKFLRTEFEPVKVEIKDNTSWSDWHINNVSLGRWSGNLDSNAEYKLVDENRPYVRHTLKGKIDEIGPQCWKIAYKSAVEKCADIVIGNPETLRGGVMEILAELVPAKDLKHKRQNIMDFLVRYSLAYWKEHYLQQGFVEADIFLPDIIEKTLLANIKKKTLTDKEMVIAGTAAQAYYFIFEGMKSVGVSYENFDQRGISQNIFHITLGMTRLIAIYCWEKKKNEIKDVIDVLKTELVDFENAYQRYNLAEYGVTVDEWKESIKSVVDESSLNLVARVSRRIAAKHLRSLGFRKEFSLDDENITTNTGHVWNQEIENVNFKWDNKMFNGIKEE